MQHPRFTCPTRAKKRYTLLADLFLGIKEPPPPPCKVGSTGMPRLRIKCTIFSQRHRCGCRGAARTQLCINWGMGDTNLRSRSVPFFRSGWEGVPDLLRFLTYNAEFDMRGCDVVRSRFCPQQELCLHVRCADRLIEVNAKLLETFGFCRGRRGRVGAV